MEPSFSINFTALMIAGETCEAGDALVFDSGAGVWRVATADVRAELGKRAEAVSLRKYGGSKVGKVTYQMTGVLAASMSGLGAGAAEWVRVSDAGRLERVTTPGPDDDLVGKAAVDGRVALDMGKWDSDNIAGSGGATPGGSDGDLQRNAEGTLAPVRTAADAVPAAGAVTRWDGTKTVWDNEGLVELPSGLAAGDLLYVDASENLVRIPIGTDGQVLTVVGGLPAWAGPAAGFDPATLSLSGWWRGSYAGSPWTPTASAGTSGTNGNLSEAFNAPATGAAVNGFTSADCDGSNDGLSAPNNLSAYVTAAAGSIVVLFRADTAVADGAVYDSPGLLGDNYGFVLGFTDAGVRAGLNDGTWKEGTVACSSAAWHAAQFKWTGGMAYVRVDGGAWTPFAAGSISNVATLMQVGKQTVNGGDFFDGQILEVMTASTALSDADMASIVSYFNSRYGLSL